MEARHRLLEDKVNTLDYARKKTTQKVNLYEKVQIPGYESAVRKIKRFLEDEENLAKAAQKIVKNRQQKEMAAQV
jgi:V/A-type H+-transporting ATPase subunit D